MTDPAIEAAQRSADMHGLRGLAYAYGLAAAREALAPIRELNVPGLLDNLAEILAELVMDTEREQALMDRYVEMLKNSATNMRPLIYPSEEL